MRQYKVQLLIITGAFSECFGEDAMAFSDAAKVLQSAGLDVQKTFFNRHVAPWAGHFFTDLEAAKASVFYAPVGSIGRTFIEIEREAFRLSPAPNAHSANT